MNKIYDVFISYRRSDGLTIAEELYKYLTSKGLRVFFDKHEMIDGHYFTTQIGSNLKIAPNYILVATDEVFNFRQGEDWVRKELEIAIAEYENNPAERTLTVLVPEAVVFPEKEDLPENIRNIADAQRTPLPYDQSLSDAFNKVLKAVTKINRRNLWFAAHRWLENSKQTGGRFASLNINENILPNASEEKKEHKELPINVYHKAAPDDKQPLLDAIAQSNSHLYLIGQGGIGKTTSLMHIMNNAYEDKQYSENAQIPIFVDLSFAPDTYGALYEGGKSSFIRRSIYKQVREDRTIKQVTAKEIRDVDEVFATIPYDIAVNPINDILSKSSPAPEYLLLLDGLNEISSVKIKENLPSVLQMVMKEIDFLVTSCPNVRVVMTSRSDDATFDNDTVSRFYLSGVVKDKIAELLESYDFSKEQIDKILKDENLCKTLKIPLFLTMYATLKNTDEASTQGEILRAFFNERRNKLSEYTMQNRLAEVEKNVSEAASAVQKNRIDADMQSFILDFIIPEIAWNMERKDEFYLSVRNIIKLIEPILTDTDDISICGDFGQELFSKYRNGASAKMHTYEVAGKFSKKLGNNMKEIVTSIVDCCVLSMGIMQESNSKYGFVHQHIRDYFAAVKNLNTLRLSAYLYEEDEKELALECMNKAFKDEPVNITVRRFMGEALSEHRNKPYLQDGIWHYNVPEEKCDRNLISRVLNAYREKFDGECGYGIYSLITTLKEIRKDLSGEDLSYLDMKYCNLNGTVLGRPYLSASFEGALVNDYTFMPPEFDSTVNSMVISPDESILAVRDNNGNILLWNLKTFSLITKINIKEPDTKITDWVHFDFTESGKVFTAAINFARFDEAFYEYWDETQNSPVDERVDKTISKMEVFTKTVHISTDSPVCIELPFLNVDTAAYASDKKYQAAKGKTYGSLKEISLDECKNLSDFKNLLADDTYYYIYQEYLSPDNKLSLWNSSDGIALYDASTGNLINCFDTIQIGMVGMADIDVFFIETGILVNFQFGATILFDYNLEFLKEKGCSTDGAVALSKNYFIFNDFLDGTIAIATTDTLDIIGTIENGCSQIFAAYLCQDNSTVFYHTIEDKAFIYDLDKNQVVDFVEAAYDETNIPFRSLCSDYGEFVLPTEYCNFSNRTPTELKTVIGYDYLRQKDKPFYHPNSKSILEFESLSSAYSDSSWCEINKHEEEKLKATDYSNGLWLLTDHRAYMSMDVDSTEFRDIVKILLCNEIGEILGAIEDHSHQRLKAIFSDNGEKVVLLHNMGQSLSYINTKDLIDEKKVESDKLKPIKNFSADLRPDLGLQGSPSATLCAAGGENNVVVTDNNTISFWNIEEEKRYKQIKHTGGLYIIDVDLSTLHSNSKLSDDTKQKLRQYGAKV